VDTTEFVIALVKFPPRGRGQKAYEPFETPNTAYGRNEVIAFYINDILGERPAEELRKILAGRDDGPLSKEEKKDKERARKQVSSHLQVLKKKFQDVPMCEFSRSPLILGQNSPDLYIVLMWLASPPTTKRGIRLGRSSPQRDRITRRTGRLASLQPNSARCLPEPSVYLPSQASNSTPLQIRPCAFRMALITDDHPQNPLHVYTEWLVNESQPLDLNAMKWVGDFPLLEQLIAQVDDDCLLNYARVTIVLPDSTIACSSKKLDIRNEYAYSGGTLGQHEHVVQTQFFNAEGLMFDDVKRCTVDFQADVLTVPFSSAKWVTLLHAHQEALKQTINCLDKPASFVELSERAHLMSEQAHISAEIREMTVLQKISYRKTNAHGHAYSKVIAAFYWKFSVTFSPGEAGVTSFGSVVRPKRTEADLTWPTNDIDSLHTQRFESSFAIKDEAGSFDEYYPSYSFDGTQSMSAPAYLDRYEQSHDASFEYGVGGTIHETANSSDGTISDREDDSEQLGDLTETSQHSMTMFDYAGMPEQARHPQLLGPLDGLALGINFAGHKNTYEPPSLHPTGLENHGDLSMATLSSDAITSFPAQSFAVYPPISTMRPQGHGLIETEPTHFHHYHRLPRYQRAQPHLDQFDAKSSSAAHAQLGPELFQSTMSFARDPSQHHQHHHQEETSDVDNLLYQFTPRLYRHDTDTTISVNDIDEFERLASQDVTDYPVAQEAQMFEFDSAPHTGTVINHTSGIVPEVHKDDNSDDLHHLSQLHELADIATATTDDDDGWELLPRTGMDSAVDVSMQGEICFHHIAFFEVLLIQTSCRSDNPPSGGPEHYDNALTW